MIYHSDFKDSFKQILYYVKPSNETNKEYVTFDFRSMILVDHKDYFTTRNTVWKHFINDRFTEMNYAYGILINPFYSKLFILDFDMATSCDVEKIAAIFMKDSNVVAVDLIKSSLHTGNDNFHLIVGFDDYYNVCNLYQINYKKACKGFIKCARELNEIVLRTSDKKMVKNGKHTSKIRSLPETLCAFRRYKNKWLNYTASNIIYPSNSIQYESLYMPSYKNATLATETSKLDLRRRHGVNSSKQKIKRKTTSTISRFRDIENLSFTDGKGCKKSTNGSDWF